MPICIRFCRALIFFAVGMAVPISAAADVRESRDSIVDLRLRRAVDLLDGLGIGISSQLTSDHNLLVLCTAGGAYCDIHALARPSVSAVTLARALEQALSGSAWEGSAVEWDQGDDWTAARARWSRGRFGSRASTMTVPLGQITAGLRAAGFVPRVVLRVPRYTPTPALSFPQNLAGPNYAWYNASAAPPGMRVTVRAALGPTALALSVAFFAFVPTITFSSLLLAILIGSSKRLPVEMRRKTYLKVARWPTFVAIGLHAPCALFYLRSLWCRAVADLWFGSSSIMATTPLIMGPPFVLVLLLPISMGIERRLLGLSGVQKAVEAQTTVEERVFRKRQMYWLFVPILAGAGVMIGGTLIPHSRRVPVSPVALIAGLIVMHGGQALVRQTLRRDAERFEGEAPDAELTQRTERLARLMGVQLKEAKVQDTPAGRLYAQAAMRPGGRLLVTRKVLEELTPAELDFILAHEIAHLQRSHLRTHVGLLMVAAGLFMLPLLLIPLRLSGAVRFPIETVFFVCSMAAVAWTFVGSRLLRQRQEYESDRLALEATGDVSAAESALTKMMRFSPLPFVHEVDDFSTHPRISRRVESLRAAARSMGKPTY